MNSAIDQKLRFCNGGICDISWGHYKGESIKQVRDVGVCFMRYNELAHFLCKFYVKEMGFQVFL